MKSCLSIIVAVVCHPIARIMRTAYIPYCSDYLGLGNRIKGLANYYARGYRRYVILWNTKCWVTETWQKLFELKDCKMHVLYPEDSWYGRIHFFLRRFLPLGIVRPETPFWSFILPHELRTQSCRFKWPFAEKWSYSVDWWFDRTPLEVREYFREFFSALQPSQEVLKRVATLKLPMGVIGVQIRNSNTSKDCKDVSSLESIFKAMDEADSDRVFFVSCMTAEVSRAVKHRLGRRILELPDKRYTSMVDAVADMWLLGQCAEMIASPSSTFSEVAWWWGGAKIPVVMLESEYNQRSMPK